MRFHRFIADRMTPGLLSSGIGLALIFACLGPLVAQDAPPPAPATTEPPFVLHAYANLVQIPTLILSRDLYALPPIDRDDINISLDSGQVFHPTHLRLEGNDPIDLAILLDLSGPGYDLQSTFSHAIADLTAHELGPRDRLSIYLKDCLFLRSAKNASATESPLVERTTEQAIHFPRLHGSAVDAAGCSESNRLWNSVAQIATSFTDIHRRHILVVISAGFDRKSHVKWKQLQHFTASRSIAIFGLYPQIETDRLSPLLVTENPLESISQLTGGMFFYTSRAQLSHDLDHIMDLVRKRYILEFPRPDNGKSGQHNIVVTLSRTDAFIRPAGFSFPLPDPASLADPTTVPSPPSPAVFGKRQTLSSPQ